MKYTEIVKISKEEYERVNKLLALSSLEEMTDEELLEAGANTLINETIFDVKFEDGSILTYTLCSGTHNYFDDVVWNKGDEEIVPECMFELCDFSFAVGNDEYAIKFEFV